MSTLSQSIVPTTSKSLQLDLTCTDNRDIRTRIIRAADGFVYDPSDGAFKSPSSITDPYVPLAESPAGSGDYTGSLPVDTWTDGNYTTEITDHTVSSNPPTIVLAGETVYVDGGSGAPVSTTLTKVNHNFGGMNALCYVDSNGNPVEDALIHVFNQVDYNSTATTLQALAISKTNMNGSWVYPVFLETGSYTIVFSKAGKWGPDTVDITVP